MLTVASWSPLLPVSTFPMPSSVSIKDDGFQVIALKPVCLDAQLVRVGLELGKNEAAVLSRLRAARFVAVGAGHLDFGTGYRCSLRIANLTRERAAGCLSHDR